MRIIKLIAVVVTASLMSNVLAQHIAVKNATHKMSSKELASTCAMLDNEKKRPRMDALQTKLLVLCNRMEELGTVKGIEIDPDHDVQRVPGTDTKVNDSGGETGATQTQNETSIALNENTGTLCSGFNDAWSGVTTGEGFTGFARSTDNGATFTDGGAFDPNSFGDPSMIWRRADGNFYLSTLHSDGLGIYRSVDDCQSFQFLVNGHVGPSDDKELMAVDNNVGSDFFGRIHLVWIDFQDARIYATFSDDGSTWSTPVPLSDENSDTQGAYPIVAADGTLYVAWVRWNPFFSGPTDMEIARSTDGGLTFTRVANPLTGSVNPYAQGPTNTCGRPALNGNIRLLTSPQLAVTPNGDLHVVYAYDPDGRNVGDVIDVFYRRSTNGGDSWLPEIKMNDDTTQNDQFFPSISAGPTGRVVVAWYDRRLDPNNLFVDYYAAVSEDGGATWGPNERISDVSSPIYIDPGLANCYHGDYDQQLQTASEAFLQWADDREVRSGHNDPNVYVDRNVFEADFFLGTQDATQEICAPDNAVYTIDVNQSLGFADPVTLSASGTPAGMTATFSANPVTPAGTSVLTIGNTAAGPAGDYTIDVTGTAGTKTRAAQLSLSVSTSTPATAALISPADGQLDVPTMVTFTWDAVGQAATYEIQIATDAAFTNLVDADQLTGTSYASSVTLNPTTTYFWRIRAANTCGLGDFSAPVSFTTQNIICVTPNIAIPDNSAAGVDSQASLGTGGTLTDLNVSIDATHTYVGDLAFTLTNNSTGTSAVIIDRPGRIDSGFGCSNNNINAILDDEATLLAEDQCSSTGDAALSGSLVPNNPLSVFDGEDLSGNWTLNVSDNAGADLGTLNEWCLQPTLAVTEVDSDGDGIDDSVDNCTDVSNADQIDSNGDGFGNACDADTNNDCVINFLDISLFSSVFLTSDADHDLNGDGVANFLDFSIMSSLFLGQPGPSALASCDAR